MKKALLIGINYNGVTTNNSIQLRGCIDDVVNLQDVLVSNYGYDLSDISVLRDDISGCLPTRENIINSLRDIITTPSGEIWIHYSGHGSQIPDKNVIKSTEFDNILIPVDYSVAGYITDNELLEYLKMISTETSAIFTFDCCHSGTICDLPWSFEYHCSRKESGFTDLIRTRVDLCDLSNSNIFVISGCKDDQKSIDTFSADYKEPMGAFTNALISCIKNGDSSIMLLYKNSCQKLLAQGYTQTPILSTTTPEPKYYISNKL